MAGTWCGLIYSVESVGSSVAPVGEKVGCSVGRDDGTGVGSPVGLPVGPADGILVGPAVGLSVGVCVGELVGVLVGAAVGEALKDSERKSDSNSSKPATNSFKELTVDVNCPGASEESSSLSDAGSSKLSTKLLPSKGKRRIERIMDLVVTRYDDFVAFLKRKQGVVVELRTIRSRYRQKQRPCAMAIL